MTNILSYLTQFAVNLIDTTGYIGIFVLSVLENAGIPIPSEVVMPFSGFLVSSGRFNLWGVVIVATVANLIGSVILFYIGRLGGRLILEKYGRYVLITKHDIESGDRWFSRHGSSAVFFGRLLPVVRTLISLPAGMSEMGIYKFTLLTLAGSLPWNFALVLVGYKAGENWDLLHAYFKKFDLVIVVLIAFGIVWYVRRHLKGKHGFR